MALSFPSSSSLHLLSPPPSALRFDQYNKFAFRSDHDTSITGRIPKSHVVQMVVSATKDSNKEVTMVDPLEAKRLAEKQMQEIKAKEKYKRKRKIEAINGGWAMIGLTAGLVVEGHTGNGILKQLVSYWDAVFGSLFH
uniref:Uncharacterized protein n=1 Tax=Kalanchoe fedtschenkoi TaxID=63787 RepID=A0A7N0SWW9_KALFE